jgi:hypothetical protein
MKKNKGFPSKVVPAIISKKIKEYFRKFKNVGFCMDSFFGELHGTQKSRSLF